MVQWDTHFSQSAFTLPEHTAIDNEQYTPLQYGPQTAIVAYLYVLVISEVPPMSIRSWILVNLPVICSLYGIDDETAVVPYAYRPRQT